MSGNWWPHISGPTLANSLILASHAAAQPLAQCQSAYSDPTRVARWRSPVAPPSALQCGVDSGYVVLGRSPSFASSKIKPFTTIQTLRPVCPGRQGTVSAGANQP